MAGGYESEDRQAELEELRREKEREARERLDAMRREQERNATEAKGKGLPSADGTGKLAPPPAKGT